VLARRLQILYAYLGRENLSRASGFLNAMTSTPAIFHPVFAAACIPGGAYLLTHVGDRE
jgi:hypothetical protein